MRQPVLLALLLLGPLAACGTDAETVVESDQQRVNSRSSWTTDRAETAGYVVALPPGWTRATEPLTPKLTDPPERLSVSTFPLRYRPTNCEAFAGSAQQDLDAHDVFLTLLERGDPTNEQYGDFPARPATFGRITGDAPEPTDCPNSNAEIQWIEFSAAGRNFIALIAFGRGASDDTRARAYRILDTLEFDPQIQPDWPASP